MSGFVAGAGFAFAVLAGLRGIWSPCGLSMVSAINPMSERSRGYRYWLTALWFGAGSLVGSLVVAGAGAVIAVALAALDLPVSVLVVVGSVATLVALASDRRFGGFHLPEHPRQVNELWLMRYRRWLYASGFGAQIGSGFATYIMTAANYLVVVLAGLTAEPRTAFGIGLCFGFVRGLAVLLSARCRSAQQLQALHRRLARWEPGSLWLVVAAEGLAAIGLAYLAGGIVLAGVAVAGVALVASVGVITGPLWRRAVRPPAVAVATAPRSTTTGAQPSELVG